MICEHQRKKSKCPVTASISVDMNDNRIKIKKQHNHLPQKIDFSIQRQALKTNTFLTPVGQSYHDQRINK